PVLDLLQPLLAHGAGRQMLGQPFEWPADHLPTQEGGQLRIRRTQVIHHEFRSRKGNTGHFSRRWQTRQHVTVIATPPYKMMGRRTTVAGLFTRSSMTKYVFDRTIALGTDVAGFFLFHPSDLAHRAQAPVGWYSHGFACRKEFEAGRLVAFDAGGDGVYRFR